MSHTHHIKLPKIGMRIVKTALAVFITLVFTDVLLSKLLKLEYIVSIYAVTSAVLTMQDNLKSSFKSAIERTLGTAVGVIIGLGFLALDLLIGQTIVFYLFAAIGTVLVIYICKIAKYVSISSLCVVVFLSILFSRYKAEPYIEAGIRVLETAIGVIISLLVNNLIVPPRKIKKHLPEITKNEPIPLISLSEALSDNVIEEIEKKQDADAHI